MIFISVFIFYNIENTSLYSEIFWIYQHYTVIIYFFQSTDLSNVNISSLVMNPSEFRSYTLKQNPIFSLKVPFKNTLNPINHGSSRIFDELVVVPDPSQTVHTRSARVSSTTRSKVV